MKTRIIIPLIISIVMPNIILAQEFLYLTTRYGKSIEAFTREEYLTKQERKEIIDDIKLKFPNAEILDSATTKYNCHSYAWNIAENDGPICWINQKDQNGNINVRKYWTNDYYMSTSSVGRARKIYYGDDVDHFGIMAPYGTTTVKSKWGSLTLMRHTIEDCPYGPLEDDDYKSDSIQYFYCNTNLSKLLKCDNGDGPTIVNQTDLYYAEDTNGLISPYNVEWVVVNGKGVDMIGTYAFVNKIGTLEAEITFTKAGLYEVYLMVYSLERTHVVEYWFEAVVEL